MRRFEGRETTVVRLLFDDVSAAPGRCEHDPGQSLQARAETKHFSCTSPRGIEQEHDEAPLPEFGGRQGPRREVARVDTGVEEDGKVERIVDEGLEVLVLVKGDAHVNLTLPEAKMRKATGVCFLFLELLGMHEKHDFGACFHRFDRRTPTVSQRPETAVASRSAHTEGERTERMGISS